MTLYKQNIFLSLNIFLCVIFLLFSFTLLRADLTSLARNDAYPVFTTLNFDETLLLTKQQEYYKKRDDADKKKDRFCFSISPFGQNANQGTKIKGHPCRTADCSDFNIPDCSTCIPLDGPVAINNALGDLTGRSGMLALLYGKIPTSATNPNPFKDSKSYLSMAFSQFFVGETPGTISDAQFIDPLQLFSYYSFPLNYRKRGVRFQLACKIYDDFGFTIQTGASSIRQVVEARINLTNASENAGNIPFNEDINIADVNQYLMNVLDNIAEEINLNINDLNQASMEEVRFNLFWRHAFEINNDKTPEWAQFLCIPYFEASGSISPGEVRKPNQLFAAPFGNNGHSSAGCTAGINFDFPDTIEFGGEVGFTHFFKKSFCDYPVPSSKFQTTIFPFQTNVSIQPGNNWHFGFRIAAYHFLENLSTYFEWLVIDHKKDKICLEVPDDAFLPYILEELSTFKTKMGNLGFNYDVSPNIGLGFLWQIPFSQRNTYRSSTVMGGINITF